MVQDHIRSLDDLESRVCTGSMGVHDSRLEHVGRRAYGYTSAGLKKSHDGRLTGRDSALLIS